MGPVDSETRSLILDGAENLLKEEGYASLTSRRVAERVGIKQQLVYYYFLTMEELIVEAFRRLAKREIPRLEAALASERPLHELWSVCSNTHDARLITEFMALAHRMEGVKKEVIAFVEQTRRMQVIAVSRAIKGADSQSGLSAITPLAITFLTTSVALAMTRESSLGISLAHPEVERLVRRCLSELEPATTKRRAKAVR
jgi:AcrR family transcriptional regulator